ncbi:DEKNAAC103463 [Brettanomyces naardenensis]|uniref:DEKNAAC103463 n=1 Tax=Brettanomyces naardenensis TaxID=13370 RepID=A0A448YND7_BRENA|nr:DEKNAAC103463 [Brettanomyces naardenensis]
MSSITNSLWDKAVNEIPMNVKIYRDFGIDATPSRINSTLYATASPAALESATVTSLLPILADIRTGAQTVKELRRISESPTTSAIAAGLRDASVGNGEDARLISLIDRTIGSICSYFAASNPTDYYVFLKGRFRMINVESLYFPSVDLLGMLHLQQNNFIIHLNLVADVLKSPEDNPSLR